MALVFFAIGTSFSTLSQATPEKAAGFYEDALKRFEKDDADGAAIQLKNAIQQDPRMLAAHLLLGKALMRSGDLKASEAAFEEAIKLGVDRSEVALPLAQLYMALGEPKMVIDRIPTANLSTNVLVPLLSLRGSAYAELGNAQAASKSFEAARTADPMSPEPLIAEVPVLLTAGQTERAAALAAKAIELAPKNGYAWNMRASLKHAALDLKSALADYDRAIQLEPRHLDARVARAALLIDLNRDADALKDLDFLTAIAAKEPRAEYLRALIASRRGETAIVTKAFKEVAALLDSLPARWVASREQYMMVGALAHHGLGNLEKARNYLEIITSRNPRNVAARKLLASIYIKNRDYGRAGPVIDALLKVLPEDPQVLYFAGTLQLSQSRYAQAAELLERAAALSGRGDMTRDLAFSQLGLGRDELGEANLEKALASNPDDSLAGTMLAMLYARRGQSQKAIKTAEQMIKRKPENLTALNFLGTVRVATGDAAAARAAFEQVLVKDANFLPATFNLAKLDVMQGRFDEGRKRLSTVLAKRSDNPDALFELGMLEQQAGRLNDAIRYLKKANESQRRDTRAGLALIEVQIARKQIDEALVTAKDMAARYPENIGIKLALARGYIAANDPGNAKNLLTGATRIAQYDPELQVTIGRLQLAAGNVDGAAYNVQKALQGKPDDVGAMVLAVEVESQGKNAPKADAALKALIAKHPKRVETPLAAAALAASRGQHGAALVAYRAALALDESTANAINVVFAQVAAGDAAKGVAFLEDWVKKNPNDPLALKALAEVQFRAGMFAPARASYTKALITDPQNAAMLNNLAGVLARLGDPEARATAEKAVKLAPGNPAYADTLGWILVQDGQVEAGLRYLREARLRIPANPEVRFHLAYALAKSGRMAEAREEMTAALANGVQAQSEEVLQLKKVLGL